MNLMKNNKYDFGMLQDWFRVLILKPVQVCRERDQVTTEKSWNGTWGAAILRVYWEMALFDTEY